MIATFTFLKLPAELRVQIYRYLLLAHDDIHIGTIKADPVRASQWLLRRRFPDRSGSQGSKDYGKMTTYWVEAIGVHTAILLVNRQTYLEGSRIIYSENRFNFCESDYVPLTDNAAMIPFLKDRSEGSRRLIKHIKYSYSIMIRGIFNPQWSADQDHAIEEICTYLRQALQLEHVTLTVFDQCLCQFRSLQLYKDYLVTLDKQRWVQTLVPLIQNLDTFTVIGGYGNELVRAAQTYLVPKIHKASKDERHPQTVKELGCDPAASEA